MWDSIGSASGLVATASDGDALIHEILETGFHFDVSRLDGAGNSEKCDQKDGAEVTCVKRKTC